MNKITAAIGNKDGKEGHSLWLTDTTNRVIINIPNLYLLDDNEREDMERKGIEPVLHFDIVQPDC